MTESLPGSLQFCNKAQYRLIWLTPILGSLAIAVKKSVKGFNCSMHLSFPHYPVLPGRIVFQPIPVTGSLFNPICIKHVDHASCFPFWCFWEHHLQGHFFDHAFYLPFQTGLPTLSYPGLVVSCFRHRHLWS